MSYTPTVSFHTLVGAIQTERNKCYSIFQTYKIKPLTI